MRRSTQQLPAQMWWADWVKQEAAKNKLKADDKKVAHKIKGSVQEQLVNEVLKEENVQMDIWVTHILYCTT